MNPPISFNDILLTAPLTILIITTIVVLVAEATREKSDAFTPWFSIAGLIAASAAAFSSIDLPGTAYAGMVNTGGYADYFAIVFCVAGILTIMLSPKYIRQQGIELGEYYALLLSSIVGMILMASAADLIVFFLGLEIMSVSFYILAGFNRSRSTSNEAALKYFLLGAFATGFLLYGIALVYGSTGSTNIMRVITVAPSALSSTMFSVGLGLLLIGLVFKVAAVPFHMWVPDVYEGSPTTVSGFMSTGGKAAAFSALLIIFAPSLISSVVNVQDVLAVVAALSMVVGNVLAISQTNLKRMLAYSSIAHAGYILTGVVAGNDSGAQGVLFYLLSYSMMNIGAFGVLSIREKSDGSNVSYEDYTGLSTRKPVLAGLMALFMFSLTGIPPFAGFFGKYYVFVGAIKAGFTWLAIIGVLMSVVSAYYYLRVVVLMYFREQDSVTEEHVPIMGNIALIISALALLLLGIFPSSVLQYTQHFF